MSNSYDVPCMDYKPSFKRKDLEQVELKIVYEDGTRSKSKCPRFTGTGGVEELLYVVEFFERLASDENIEDEALFLYFKKILEQNARNKWDSLEPETYPQDQDGFKDCIKQFYKKYSSQVNTRGILIKSLRSKKVMKPIDVSVDEHQERIENLCRYANKLHGTGAPLQKGDKLEILFESFPTKWKNSFILSGKVPSETDESVMIEFMKINKGINDGEEKKKGKRKTDDDDKKKGKNRWKKGKGKGRNGGRGGRGKPADPEATCWVHKNHKWKDCPNNYNSTSFVPRNETAGRGGRGERDTAGRGGYGGRGAYHTQAAVTPPYPALPPSEKSGEAPWL